MHIVAAVLAAVAAAYFLVIRARNAAEMTHELAGVAGDVMAAARRFGFRRKHNAHPAECIEDPKIAIAGIAEAFLQLDSMPTQEQRDRLKVEIAKEFTVSAKEAEELMILGTWIVSECKGPLNAVPRLSRVLFKLQGTEAITPLLSIVQNTLAPGGGELSERQREALHDVQRGLRVT